jgi:hypothetical protein
MTRHLTRTTRPPSPRTFQEGSHAGGHVTWIIVRKGGTWQTAGGLNMFLVICIEIASTEVLTAARTPVSKV